MRAMLLALEVILILFLACVARREENIKRIITSIDLDELDAEIEKISVPAKVVYYNEWYASNLEDKEKFIPTIENLTGGPGKSLYTLDHRNSRVVQLSDEGEYMRSYGGPGSGPGEFMNPIEVVCSANNFFYIVDTYGMRLQVFDANFHYNRTLSNVYLEDGMFSIGPNNFIYSMSCRNAEIKDQFIISQSDSLGKAIKGIGRINKTDHFAFSNNIRQPYFVITNEKSQHIWCISKFLPLIRKYDFEGNLLEEIRFKSKDIESLMKISEASLIEKKLTNKNNKIVGGRVIISCPQLHRNNHLFINIGNHGNLEISSHGATSRVIKKYSFHGISDLIKKGGNQYIIAFINESIYAFHRRGVILKADNLH
jgi:hypothetical protein